MGHQKNYIIICISIYEFTIVNSYIPDPIFLDFFLVSFKVFVQIGKPNKMILLALHVQSVCSN